MFCTNFALSFSLSKQHFSDYRLTVKYFLCFVSSLSFTRLPLVFVAI